MSYEKLRDSYRITEEDMKEMDRLRRKWAFADVMDKLKCGAYDDVEPTEEQIEDIIT